MTSVPRTTLRQAASAWDTSRIAVTPLSAGTGGLQASVGPAVSYSGFGGTFSVNPAGWKKRGGGSVAPAKKLDEKDADDEGHKEA